MDKSSCFLCSTKINSAVEIETRNFRIFQIQLFRLLRIPPKNILDLQKLCIPERLCFQCLRVAEEIIHLRKQILSLELKIEHKVETIGRGLVDATSALEADTIDDITESWSKERKEWWIKFQYPVIQNFAKGYLPSPQVRIKKYDCQQSLEEPTVVTQRPNSEPISSEESELDENATYYDERDEADTSHETTELPCVNIAQNIFEDPLPSNISPLGLRSCNNSDKASKDVTWKEDERFHCPVDDKCTYTIEYGRRSRRTFDNAISSLCRHYSHGHCEPHRFDIYTVNTVGQQCFPCKFCSFQALVKEQKKKSKSNDSEADARNPQEVLERLRRNAIHLVIKHEMKIHFLKLTPKKVGRKPIALSMKERELQMKVSVPSRKWIQRVFHCPWSTCDFSYDFKWYGEDDEQAPQGLQKLGDHCLQFHLDQNFINPGLHILDDIKELGYHYRPHVDILDDIQHLRCPYPECGSCIFILDKDHTAESCRLFAEHYGAHMYNKSNKKS